MASPEELIGSNWDLENTPDHISLACELKAIRQRQEIRDHLNCIQNQIGRVANELHRANVRKERNIWIKLKHSFMPRKRPFHNMFH